MLHFYLISCVQIVLESFPVSSSGHCFLLQKIFSDFFSSNLSDVYSVCSVTAETFFNNKLVTHFLHGPTVFVLAFFFFRRWSFLLIHFRSCWKVIVKLIFLMGLSGSATAVLYIVVKVFHLSSFPLWIGFFLSACALFSLRFIKEEKRAAFSWSRALILGLVQGVALLPGISRMGVVFVAARWLGLSKKKSFEVTFLIFWPLTAAAFLNSVTIRAWYADLCVWHVLFSVRTLSVFFVASVVAFFSLWFVWFLVQKKKMWIFSLYLLLPTILCFFL